jgi:cold shock CspA family protein
MARSQGTQNKKELEKKRMQKRKDKEQRKEERKANAKEGKTLEDMMAYVDEFGNITSTPPDPTKKKTIIKEDEILLGARKIEAEAPGDKIRTGKVTFFNNSKGFGFIKDLTSQESIFVHSNGLLDAIRENDKVTFETERGFKGLNAIKVKLAR